jgi:hypothetical protein
MYGCSFVFEVESNILSIDSYPKAERYTLNVMALKLPNQDCKVIEFHSNVFCV